jgi:hypothetical protein
MKEYLINVGDFNIIVLPDKRQYFIVGDSEASAEVQNQFIQGQPVAYSALNPLWFQYEPDESWKDFAQKPYRLGEDVSEDELVSMYVLKKFNFGSLVAVRDSEGGKVKVFKRDMLTTRATANPVM